MLVVTEFFYNKKGDCKVDALVAWKNGWIRIIIKPI